jgi:Uncharacterized conserved small protein
MANDAQIQSFYSVWDALEDTGGAATRMKLKCHMAMALEDHIKARRWSKAVAAKRCGVSIARLAELDSKLNSFTIDDLATMLGQAGLELRIRAVKSTFAATPAVAKPQARKKARKPAI